MFDSVFSKVNLSIIVYLIDSSIIIVLLGMTLSLDEFNCIFISYYPVMSLLF